MRSRGALVLALVVLVLAIVPTRAADTLPAQLSDAAFWKMITDFSEPDGFFQYVVITSNETAYQEVIPQLTKAIPTGGTYLGVGPEQNFTYIAALQPKSAIINEDRIHYRHSPRHDDRTPTVQGGFRNVGGSSGFCRHSVFEKAAGRVDRGVLRRSDLSRICIGSGRFRISRRKPHKNPHPAQGDA